MKKIVFTGILLSIFSTFIRADSQDYDFIEFGFTTLNTDREQTNFNGVDIRWNYSLDDAFYIGGDSFRADLNNSIEKKEINTLGLGYRFNMTNKSSIFTKLDWVVVDPKGHDNHEHGAELSAGIRSNITERLELLASLKRLETSNFKMTRFVVGATYQMSKRYSVYSDIQAESDSTRFTVGARYSF
jgi:predicted porin